MWAIRVRSAVDARRVRAPVRARNPATGQCLTRAAQTADLVASYFLDDVVGRAAIASQGDARERDPVGGRRPGRMGVDKPVGDRHGTAAFGRRRDQSIPLGQQDEPPVR